MTNPQTTALSTVAGVRDGAVRDRPRPTGFGVASIGLAATLVLNTVLGPLGVGLIEYPLSDTLRNQLIGLEIVTVAMVVPLSVAAGILAFRNHRAAAALAFGPAAYTAYMFAQYVLGPEYAEYRAVILFQVAVFAFGVLLAVWAWQLIDENLLPAISARRARLYGIVLLALAAFVISRYLGAISGCLHGSPIPEEFAEARAFYWSIVLLDLGVVVPATVAAGVGLLRGARWSGKALYAVLGWFFLVPPSVAAMAAVMLVNDDPDASAGQVLVFAIAAVVFAAFAVRVFLPLLATTAARCAAPLRSTQRSRAGNVRTVRRQSADSFEVTRVSRISPGRSGADSRRCSRVPVTCWRGSSRSIALPMIIVVLRAGQLFP